MAVLLEEQKKFYMDNHGYKCPICHSENMIVEKTGIFSGNLNSHCKCYSCGAKFVEIYKLADVMLEL